MRLSSTIATPGEISVSALPSNIRAAFNTMTRASIAGNASAAKSAILDSIPRSLLSWQL